MIRGSVVFVVFGLLAAGVLYDRVDPPDLVDTTAAAERIVTPAMQDPSRLDSAWFCPVGSSTPDGFADHTLQISNLGDDTAAARVAVLSASGSPPVLRLDLAPRSTQILELSEVAQSDLAGAVVEIVGGIGVVGHTVTTPQGTADGPCATHVSDSWFFAGGRSTDDTKEHLVLMNPFPEDAIFSVAFHRAAGRPRQPQALTGAVVPGNSVRSIDLTPLITREDNVAAVVTTLRGRLVVERLQVADGSEGPKGAALQLGAPGTAESWMLPAGRVHEGGQNRVIVFNPSPDETAEVAVELWPINPTDRSLYGLTALPRQLLPGRFEVIELDNEADRFGLRLPYELGVSVTSTNGVPVVVERWHFANEIAGGEPAEEEAPAEGEGEPVVGDAVDPGELDVPGIFGGEAPELPQVSPDTGLATSRGTEVLSDRWVFPWISTPSAEASAVVVTSPQDANVEVRALVNGVEEGPWRATVPAGGRAIVSIPISAAGAPVVLQADRPVSAEVQVVNPGISYATVAGVPTVAS